METTDELYRLMDQLSAQIKEAQADCQRLYHPWREASERLHRLERERGNVWAKLNEAVIGPHR